MATSNRVLGETWDVHWTPWSTERMTLLPTWTSQDRATNGRLAAVVEETAE
jgi:hypothetical protein